MVDLPFGSYEGSAEVAYANAARVMKETGCNAVKVEAGPTVAENIEYMVRRGIPVICSGRPMLADPPVPYVDVDHAGGVAAALRYLINSGRQRIATIAGPQDMVAGLERLTGYRETLQAAGLPSLVSAGDFTRESGVTAMRALLDQDPGLDAVFAASDLMAHGALQALRDAGRRVPDDVAVIGFDDIADAALTDPPLTTVSQPLEQMTNALAELLLRRIGGLGDEDESVVVPTHLIQRASA